MKTYNNFFKIFPRLHKEKKSFTILEMWKSSDAY